MMDRVSVVRFENKQGVALHGILEQPDPSVDRSICILLLSPGIKMRVAPHQLYRKMSNHFIALGFTVFRFDFYGLGDSEGVVEEEFLADLYGSVQIGRYVDDTLSAMNWIADNHSIDKFIAAGLCGGAITGLLTSRSDARVEGLLGLGIPVILDSSKMNTSTFLTSGHLDRLHKGYIKRLFSVKSWLRLLTFQSDYKVIWKILSKKLGIEKPVKAAVVSSKSEPAPEPDNTNPLFAPAIFDMMDQGKKVEFIFSGSDRLDWEYEEKFVDRYKDKLNEYAELLDVSTIPDANHILSMPEWQATMLDKCTVWLNTNFKG